MELCVNNLSKELKASRVLDDINLKLTSGVVYGLRGENGSGKTMFIRALCGLIKPSSGGVVLDGKVLRQDISFPDIVGVLIETPSFIGKYTGYKNLELLASIKNRASEQQDIRETLDSVGLNSDDTREYKKYSLGMKQ